MANRVVGPLSVGWVATDHQRLVEVGRALEWHRSSRANANRPEADDIAVGERVRLLRPDGFASTAARWPAEHEDELARAPVTELLDAREFGEVVGERIELTQVGMVLGPHKGSCGREARRLMW